MGRGLIGVILVSLLSSSAVASKEATVRRHKTEAFRRLEAGDFRGAIAEMEKAHALIPHPGFLLNIAVAYDRWDGHCSESLEAFDRFFEECPTCELFEKASKKQREIDRLCHVEVAVASAPEGASVAIDGAVRGRTPFSTKLLPGSYSILLDKTGHERRTEVVTVAKGKPVHLSIDLVSKSDLVEPRSDPPPPAPPPPIAAEALIETEGPSPLTWVAFGVGAAGVATGIAFTVLTVGALDDEKQARSTPLPKEDIVSFQREAKRDAIIAHVAYGAGAAGIATGVLLFFVTGGEQSVAIGPALGPGSVGIYGAF